MRFGLFLAALGLVSCTSASPAQPQCTPPGASVPCDCGGAEGRAFCGADERLGTCVCPDAAAAQTDAAAADAGRDVGTDHLPTQQDCTVDAGADASSDAAADAPFDSAPEDRGDTPHADVASDTAQVPYPSGPYGSRVGAVFEPFALTACNREGDAARWRFDQQDFRDNQLTLLMISAMWCVPCQNEAMQVERELVQRYAGRGLRIVQVLVQDAQRRAITPIQCTTWVNRYSLSFPVLMDPQFAPSPSCPWRPSQATSWSTRRASSTGASTAPKTDSATSARPSTRCSIRRPPTRAPTTPAALSTGHAEAARSHDYTDCGPGGRSPRTRPLRHS